MFCSFLGFFLLLPAVFNIVRPSHRPGPFTRSDDQIMQNLLPMIFCIFQLFF